MTPDSQRSFGSDFRRFFFRGLVTILPTVLTIVLFVNALAAFDAGYRRFLLNQMRQRLPFAEVPIRLMLRPRGRSE